MNKPEATPEVTAFLETWEEYRQAIADLRFTNLEAYRGRGVDFLGVVNYNAEAIIDNAEKMRAIRDIGDKLAFYGQDVANAATEYRSALYDWERKQEEEADRPRREWEAARLEYIKNLKSTIRSLSIKIGHAENKAYARGLSETEKEAATERLKSLRAERTIAEQLDNAVSWLRWEKYQGQAFTEQIVLDYIETQKENWAHIIEQLTGQTA